MAGITARMLFQTHLVMIMYTLLLNLTSDLSVNGDGVSIDDFSVEPSNVGSCRNSV
ncbi:MAG: hypothetical protein IPK08_19310 [Bacteroidetes bacterium]|nr:hypothetical protein [Bacteroidota bacterium]